MATATLAPPAASEPAAAPPEPWYDAMAGVIVAAVGLVVLLAIVAIAILTIPNDDGKAQNVTAVATSAFGVVGTVVGAYFGVRAANRAVDRAHARR